MILILYLVASVFAPFGLLYSINTLFNKDLKYDSTNWMAAFILIAIIKLITL